MEASKQHDETETQEALIERLLAKSDLDFKCCGALADSSDEE